MLPSGAWELWRIVTAWDCSRRFAAGLVTLLLTHTFIVIMFYLLLRPL
jgi:hypothetical protein